MTRWEYGVAHLPDGGRSGGGAEPTEADRDERGEQRGELAASLTGLDGRSKRETRAFVFEPLRE